MIVACVHVHVKPDLVDQFIHATVENHKESIKEPGNLRFDVLQDPTNPAKFLLYEAYNSEEAAAAHKNTAHYLRWRDTVADMMAEPRKADKYTIIAPSEK